MNFPFLDTNNANAAEPPVALPVPKRQKQVDPAGYLPEPELLNAVNIALLLGQPLLLTGEPGTGKTQLAHWLSWRLGFGDAVVFNTKSTSTARDLFYTFDSMRRFHAAQTGKGSQDEVDYITYNAFGVAILRSLEFAAISGVLPKQNFVHGGPRRSVVLIDEIDKAPRDFPNDLLHEVENMSFSIAELGITELKAERKLRPVLVLTSNSEKNLPDAFLRRCIFFNIPFPGRDRLKAIVQARLDAFADGQGALLNSAIDLFIEIHGSNLRKAPSTAELLNWLQTLSEAGAPLDQPLSKHHAQLSESTLAKTIPDVGELRRLLASRLVK
jgi:MoxR-like ATPase